MYIVGMPWGLLRTIRPGKSPSEMVVSLALKNKFPEFLMGGCSSLTW